MLSEGYDNMASHTVVNCSQMLIIYVLLLCSKNYGSAVLSPPITLWMFAIATLFHGGMFSALWTYLGVDSAARLESTVPLPADPLLQFLLTLALINGIVISPVSMAYWVRTLQEKSNNDGTQRRATRKK
jgi:hypothetical protein